MTPGLTSIIIPTYNDADVLPAAIESALAQTAPVEVIVVDDGSTEGDFGLISANWNTHGDRLRILSIAHAGPGAARNAGIDAARGEFVTFLDADDTIEPTKVELQLAHMDADAGWVLCDVRIMEVDGRVRLASEKYGYTSRHLNGWIQPQLGVKNFIPVHSPLIRRSVLGDRIRFPTSGAREDWFFWYDVAGEGRVRYTPAILATYRKRRGSRNHTIPRGEHPFPGVVEPLRLNLGCGTPEAASWHPMPGMVNLDKSLGWKFEDGLRDFGDATVAGITISHSLMYVRAPDWPAMCREFHRVLKPGGVVRITEDDATNPASSRFGGWKGSESAVTLTDAAMVRKHLEAAGFAVHDVTATETHFADGSLMQAQHGTPPDVFFLEGVRPTALILTPHADDEVLFAAFSMIRHRPRVAVCFPSEGDYGDTATRAAESGAAAVILGAGPVEQWDGTDLVAKMREIDARIAPARVFAPSAQSSHPDHVAVARAAAEVFGDRLTRFHTYDEKGKVRTGDPVPFEPGWIALKRRALECFRTQREHPRARVFFDESRYQLTEFVEP